SGPRRRIRRALVLFSRARKACVMSEYPPPYGTSDDPIQRLEELRRHEKDQALLCRSLAARAEEAEVELAQRFHDLHADEQHHLSRLTARVLELGGRPADLSAARV